MNFIAKIAIWMWWLVAAYIPVYAHNVERNFMDGIGCPPKGDCSVPGSEILLDFDLLIIFMVVWLWPICAWQLIGKFFYSAIKSRLTRRSSKYALTRAA